MIDVLQFQEAHSSPCPDATATRHLERNQQRRSMDALRIEVVPLNLDVPISLQINLAFLQWNKTPRLPQD